MPVQLGILPGHTTAPDNAISLLPDVSREATQMAVP
jgi:hypothetical protein